MQQTALFTKVEHTELKKVPVTDIKPWREEARAVARSANKSSLEQLGHYGTITLRRIPGAYPYEVVAGNRTLDGLVAAGHSEVAAAINDADDFTAAAISLTSNVARLKNELHEAENIKTLRAGGMSDEAIARLGGVSVTSIRRRARLLELPGDLYDAVRHGNLSPAAALNAVKLQPGRLETVREKLAAGKVTQKEVGELKRVERDEAFAELGVPLFDVAKTPETLFLAAVTSALAAGLSPEQLQNIIAGDHVHA